MQWDSTLGLYYDNARIYDPNTGRFLSQDPLGFAADPNGNLYNFVGNDPTGASDPSGMDGVPPPGQPVRFKISVAPVKQPSAPTRTNNPATVIGNPNGFDVDLFWQNVQKMDPKVKEIWDSWPNKQIIFKGRQLNPWSWDFWGYIDPKTGASQIGIPTRMDELEAAKEFIKQMREGYFSAWVNAANADTPEGMADWTNWFRQQIAKQGLLAWELTSSWYRIQLVGVDWVITVTDAAGGDPLALAGILLQLAPMAKNSKIRIVSKDGKEIAPKISLPVIGKTETLAEAAKRLGLTEAQLVKLFGACFAAGTPLRTPTGSKLIEEFKPGDAILSRDENDPQGPVSVKAVEDVFIRTGQVWKLQVSGQTITTTAEHPFYEQEHGWVQVNELHIGNRLLTMDDRWVTVEEMVDLDRWETVYNLRVADWHTYFVGCQEWGFSVWAHNLCTKIVPINEGTGGYRLIAGEAEVGVYKTAKEAEAAAAKFTEDVPVIGRLADTKVADELPGHVRLNINDWTLAKNDAWIESIVAKKQPVYVGSPTNRSTLWDAVNNRETVLAREIRQLEAAGYKRSGNWYLPPGLTP